MLKLYLPFRQKKMLDLHEKVDTDRQTRHEKNKYGLILALIVILLCYIMKLNRQR